MSTPSPSAEAALTDLLKELCVTPPDNWWATVRHFHELLSAANERCNLTRLTAWDQFLIKHIADSLLPLPHLPELRVQPLQIADIGCGGGFPGIPLALTFPQLSVTEIDSSRKKIDCVVEFLKALELERSSAVCGRARELGRREEYQGRYDIVVARAVSSTPELIRETKRLLSASGTLLAYKSGAQTNEERDAVEREARKARLEATLTEAVSLPLEQGERRFWIVRRRS